MTEDQLVFWLIAVPGAMGLAAGVGFTAMRAVLRAVRRRRDRETFARSLAEWNAVRDEQAAWRALDEGLDRLYAALGEPPHDTRGEDR